jgi:hypothetical protein
MTEATNVIYHIAFDGGPPRMLCIDYAVTIHADAAGHSLTIRIEGPFKFGGEGRVLELKPENTSSLAPILSLMTTSMESLTVSSTGDLRIQFTSGALLSVAAGGQFEAWSVAVDNGPLMIGGPGKTVAVFDRRESEG